MTKAVSTMRIVVLLSLAVFVSNGFSQNSKQQTTFGSEMEIEKPVRVPSSFFKLMDKADRQRLNECQHKADFPELRKKNRNDHFVGSAITVRNKNGGLDLLVVQANSLCFWGFHNTRFWILAKKKGEPITRYKKLFDVQADGIDVSTTATRIYPDIDLMSHTAIEMFTSTLRYSQGRYRERFCYVEDMGNDSPNRPKIRCSKYNWEFRK